MLHDYILTTASGGQQSGRGYTEQDAIDRRYDELVDNMHFRRKLTTTGTQKTVRGQRDQTPVSAVHAPTCACTAVRTPHLDLYS